MRQVWARLLTQIFNSMQQAYQSWQMTVFPSKKTPVLPKPKHAV
jgi:hypothetical protein